MKEKSRRRLRRRRRSTRVREGGRKKEKAGSDSTWRRALKWAMVIHQLLLGPLEASWMMCAPAAKSHRTFLFSFHPPHLYSSLRSSTHFLFPSISALAPFYCGHPPPPLPPPRSAWMSSCRMLERKLSSLAALAREQLFCSTFRSF